MKNILFTFLGLFLMNCVFSQDSDAQLIRNIFDLEKDEIVKYNMNLSADKQSVFWSIYQEYESRRQEQGKRRVSLMQEYMKSYESLTEEKTTEIADKLFALERDFIDLKEDYYRKVAQRLNSQIAGRFIQLEEYIHSRVKAQIFEDIRFIEASSEN